MDQILHDSGLLQIEYWDYIRAGLWDYDPLSRKLSIKLLKLNLQRKLKASELDFAGLKQKEFDKLWETFFEVYDTLDSYSSHLTKAIWERMELLYQTMAHEKADGHPLTRFSLWQVAICQRS